MILLIAMYLAGLSFFFTGVAGISENLRQLSGQRFRKGLARATNHPILAGLLGTALGAVTQSTSVVAFLLTGMTASGMLAMPRALIVLACSNLGTALLVFIAALDLHLPTLFLIGVTGLVLAFKLFNYYRPGIAGLLSVGLVLFGLDMMKQAFHPLSSADGVAAIGRFLNYWPDAAFFAGMLLRSVIHSSSAVAAITITINKGGILNEYPSMMSMAGLGMGTALASFVLSSNLRGIPRQISAYQAATNFGAGLLMAALLTTERFTHVPLLIAAVNRVSPSMSGRMACMYFLFNVAILLVALAGIRWAPAWLERWCPPTPEQDLSRPMYLQLEALNSPETALDLVSLEQMRVMRAVDQYLQIARGDLTTELAPLHEAAGILDREIAMFLEALVGQPMSASLAARTISFQRKQETLRALEENVFLFAETLRGQGNSEQLGGRLVEALDTILLTASDGLRSKDKMDVDLLVQMTDDRGGMMERLRSRLSVDGSEAVGDIAALHYATTLFERNIWLLRQLALWMREDLRDRGTEQ